MVDFGDIRDRDSDRLASVDKAVEHSMELAAFLVAEVIDWLEQSLEADQDLLGHDFVRLVEYSSVEMGV